MNAIYTTKIPAIIGKANSVAKDIIVKAALDIEGRAKDAAPVDTGYLKNSAFVEVNNSGDNQSVVIGFGAEYAIYNELGTYKMPARPFLSPACMVVFPQMQKALGRIAKP